MTVADPLRLSRRDRAALTLALEWARTVPGRGGGPTIALDEAWRCLMGGRDETRRIADARRVVRWSRNKQRIGDRWRRLLRARLALLLRAVLRADAYERDAVELGVPASILMRWPPVCDGCGEPVPNHAIGDRVNVCPKRAGHPVARQARPLWQSAPPRAR